MWPNEPEMSDGGRPLPMFGDVTPCINRAKNITLYVNGDQHFHGKTMVVNRRFTHTWEAFLLQATERTGVTFAVRDVLTPVHGTKVNSFDELVDGSSYVVSKGNSFKFKPIG